ncbi:MAG: hypothetical protein ISS74_06900 [Planctomycetes bacterium]|nr:hypothetical protein [Planctomycetota bacterium]
MVPLFVATERFDPSDAERWQEYCKCAQIPGLVEVVSLDMLLCPRLVKAIKRPDWDHIVIEDFRSDYFYHLDYLLKRVRRHTRRNILGVYRNPEAHITRPPGPGDFAFVGYDLIEEATQISAVTDCGGFPNAFSNQELNPCGLISDYARAAEVRIALREQYPDEPHADCELYAVWRLNESSADGSSAEAC